MGECKASRCDFSELDGYQTECKVKNVESLDIEIAEVGKYWEHPK